MRGCSDRKTAGGRVRALNLIERERSNERDCEAVCWRSSGEQTASAQNVSAKHQRGRVTRAARTTAAKSRNGEAKRTAAHSVRAEESMALNQKDNRRVPAERRDGTDSSAQRRESQWRSPNRHRTYRKKMRTYHKLKQTSQLRLTQYPCRHE